MKKFKVIETKNKKYFNKQFEVETKIKNNVKLPFTSNIYRCIMFDGIRIHLIYEDELIVGIIN